MLFSTCTNDDSIGPSVLGCRDDFDFTVKFEQLFFSLIPSVLFIICSAWRITALAKRPIMVHAPMLQLVKLGTIATYVGLQLALLVLVGTQSFNVTSLAIASTALQFVAALCMVGLSFMDHSRSPRPSVLLNSYLFITTLLDVAQVRTFWLASGTRSEMTYAAVFTTCMALKIVILLLEAQRKARWVDWDSKVHSPEETSGIYSLGVYFWLNSLFLRGYNNILRIQDLYPLDVAMSGDVLKEAFVKHADYTKYKDHKYALVKDLARTLKVHLLLPVPARLALMGFSFCQPFFIHSLLEYLSSPHDGKAASNAAYGFIGASILIYSGNAISQALQSYFHFRMLTMARGCLVTALYGKALEAQFSAIEKNETVTLMSTDIERIVIGFHGLHDIWAGCVEVGLASWLLYGLLGPAFVGPIAVISCCALTISILVRYTGGVQRTWMDAVQKRVGLTGNVIASMKGLKISGLAIPITNFVHQLRLDEIKAGRAARGISVIAAIASLTPLVLSPLVAFAAAQRELNAAKVFTSLSYLMLLSNPLIMTFQAVPQIVSALACLGRIQAFLACTTREDMRTVIASIARFSEKQAEEDSQMASTDSSEPAIIIRDGQFGWTKEKMALRNINLEVPKSYLTVVVGPIASGKSTLTKALLGEIPVSEGRVEINTKFPRIGFCDQIAFLSDGSLRDNIIGFSSYDERRYAEVIDATMLRFDLENLPSGDRTNIGSNGITLSGGQRQRVSLARALYLHTDLLIFDDVFSGLDADTEDQVFQRVFGTEGLLKRRKTTTLLCTHSIRHLPFADHIVALGQDGTIAEQGAFKQLTENNGYIQSLDIKSSRVSEVSSEITAPSIASLESPTEPLRKVSTIASVSSETDKARQTGDRTVYKHYFKSMGYITAILAVLSGALIGGLHNFATVWLKFWSDDGMSETPSHSFAFYMGIYGLIEGGVLLSVASLCFMIFIVAVAKSGANIHQLMLKTLVLAPLKFFTVTDQGVILNLFSQDLNLIDMTLPNSLTNTLFSVFLALGAAAVLVTSSPYMAISYPFLFALLWIVQRFYLRTSRQLRLLDLEAKSPLYAHFLDTTKGIVTIRAFGFIDEDKAKSMSLLDTSQRPAYLLTMIQQWLVLVLKLVVMALAVALTALAVKMDSNSGFTGASLVTLMSFGETLSEIVMHYTQLETSIGAIARVRAFHETVKPEDQEQEVIRPSEEWPVKGEIEFKGVSASYGSDTTSTTEPPKLALRNIKLTVNGGEKIAICGRTGSGKSSLVALVMKLLEPVSDTPDNVFIDGVSLSKLERQTLRIRLLAVPQDCVFLPDGTTVQENLDPFHSATVTECQAVLETVGLWPFIQERGGLQADMCSGTLSQGQRQLFSLARVVLRRRIRAKSLGLGGGGSEGGILLLDEVSSSVDLKTERTMQEIISVEFENYTIMAVSHRLDMIMDFDRVVVMDKGEVVEIGSPRQLVEVENSRFGDLWRAGGN